MGRAAVSNILMAFLTPLSAPVIKARKQAGSCPHRSLRKRKKPLSMRSSARFIPAPLAPWLRDTTRQTSMACTLSQPEKPLLTGRSARSGPESSSSN